MTEFRNFPTDWQKGIAIVAHPDDLEYNAAAAFAKWIAQGKDISYVLVSSGERGIPQLNPETCKQVREKEQKAAATTVGVSDVTFLGFPDSEITNSAQLRHSLEKIIDARQPDTVFTINFSANWPGGSTNFSDHINTGCALTQLWEEKGYKIPIAVFGSPRPTHFEDIKDYLDVAGASLACHTQYLKSLGDEKPALQIVTSLARSAGSLAGVEFAALAEII